MIGQPQPRHEVLSAREKIISGIGTPLGFFVLALFIVEGFLWGAGSAFDLPVEVRIYALWIGVALFVLVLAIVVALVIFFPQNLVFSEKSHLHAMAIYGAKGKPISEISMNGQPQILAADETALAQICLSERNNGEEGND